MANAYGSATTFSIMTFIKMTLGIMVSIVTLIINDTQHIDTWNNYCMPLCCVLHSLNVLRSVVILTVVMLTVIMLTIVMLTVVMVTIIMLTVLC
jgi:hypothetical protein